MKCQRCPKQVAYHITDVLGPEQFEEFHLCEDCAKKHLNEPPPTKKMSVNPAKPTPVPTSEPTSGDPGSKQCEVCGLKFVEFRNSGRLGCPDDYDEFREELLPLLESIHGEVKHAGKSPRRSPQPRSTKTELTQLRKQLSRAVADEAYEEAARIRDRIKQLEEG